MTIRISRENLETEEENDDRNQRTSIKTEKRHMRKILSFMLEQVKVFLLCTTVLKVNNCNHKSRRNKKDSGEKKN